MFTNAVQNVTGKPFEAGSLEAEEYIASFNAAFATAYCLRDLFAQSVYSNNKLFDDHFMEYMYDLNDQGVGANISFSRGDMKVKYAVTVLNEDAVGKPTANVDTVIGYYHVNIGLNLTGNLTRQPTEPEEVDCPLGDYNRNPYVCADCEPGTYADAPGMEQCNMCDFGEYAGLKKQPTCIRCQHGATVLSLWVRTK